MVRGWRAPLVASKRTRFERPCSVVATITDLPSGAQTIGLEPSPPRGGAWSPSTAPPTSKS